MSKPLVYLAGPYTNPDPVENTHNTCKLATWLYEQGLVVPVVPHINLVWHMVTPRPEEFWYEYDLHLLRRCDAVLRIEGRSKGADAEVWDAMDHDIPVFYDLNELTDWATKQ